jgi:hypothetical protein
MFDGSPASATTKTGRHAIAEILNYENKFKQVMVNNVINTNNHFSPQLTKYEKKRHT